MFGLAALALVLAFGDSPFERTDFPEALAEARRLDKVVLLGFTAGLGEDQYTRMIGSTFQDPELVEWIELNAIAVRPEIFTSVKLMQRYELHSHPTHILLNHDGYEIDRIEGQVDAASFLRLVQEAQDGRGLVYRARLKLEENEGAPMDRLRLARALVRAGEFREALEHFLWCFDHGADARGFGGVRLSYLIVDLRELGAIYTPTRGEIEKRTASLLQRIQEGEDGYRVIADYASLNEALQEERATLALLDSFLAREDASSKALRNLAQEVEDLLLEDQRYEELHAYAGKTLKSLQSRQRGFKKRVSWQAPYESDPELEERIACIAYGLDVYEVLLGLNRTEEAQEATRLLLTVRENEHTYYGMVLRAIKAERLAEARRVKALGLEKLDGKERKWLQRRLRRKLP